MRQAQGNDVMVRFFLTEEERTPATDEVRQNIFGRTPIRGACASSGCAGHRSVPGELAQNRVLDAPSCYVDALAQCSCIPRMRESSY